MLTNVDTFENLRKTSTLSTWVLQVIQGHSVFFNCLHEIASLSCCDLLSVIRVKFCLFICPHELAALGCCSENSPFGKGRAVGLCVSGVCLLCVSVLREWTHP